MPSGKRRSDCSSGLPVNFYWHTCRRDDGHIAAAVEELMAAVLRRAGRVRNRYWESDARAGFRRKLEKARRGELDPIDEVDNIDLSPDGTMFEIRWTGFKVVETNGRGRERQVEAEVRLLHVEPHDIPFAAIGLHAHEKIIDPRGKRWTRLGQDAEIRTALAVYRDGFASRWGLGL